jgi:dTDP-4-dehydrorhamnose 3,5-epimerase
MMRVIETILPGVLILEPKVHGDSRGFFQETWRADTYSNIGIPPFVQDNHSRSSKGVLRGLHAQRLRPQGKLVRVSRGVFDVAVDINPHSATFGKHVGVELSDATIANFMCHPVMRTAFVCCQTMQIFFTSAPNIISRVTKSACCGMIQPSAFSGLSAIHCCRPKMKRCQHCCVSSRNGKQKNGRKK